MCTGCGGARDQQTKMCSGCLSKATARGYRVRVHRRELAGMCRDCGKPTWSENTKRCRYHYVYSILYNFMPRVPPSTIEAVASKLEQQDFRCALTGLPLVPGRNASLDHVYPRSVRPDLTSRLDNLVRVDRMVNEVKQNLSSDDPILEQVLAPELVQAIRSSAAKVHSPAPSVG